MSTTTQGKVTAPNCGYPGDSYNTAFINQGLTQAATVTKGGVKIGRFCFGVNDTTNIQQLYEANKTVLAGFVIRAQNTPMPWDALYEGSSMLISDGLQANFVSSGSFLADVISLNAGGAIKMQDKVYVRISDSATIVSTAALSDGYIDTGWKVTKTNPQAVNYNARIVVISNQQTFN